ncbi:MAG TPA: LpxD N-terminal domain-containing protein, partial [Rhizomicrobium sp.]|nr:LpxD N-terminal domain-containing protein [Rhizomicrobium sp.]
MRSNVSLPSGVDGTRLVEDVASLPGAGPMHLSFFTGARASAGEFAETQAGYCFVPQQATKHSPSSSTILLPCVSVTHAFAAAARMLYPESAL